jgi:hypothetical protein
MICISTAAAAAACQSSRGARPQEVYQAAVQQLERTLAGGAAAEVCLPLAQIQNQVLALSAEFPNNRLGKIDQHY